MSNAAYHIALIDDETQILDALERLLQSQYQIHKFSNPLLFLEYLKSPNCPTFAVIISDQKMPELLGAHMLAKTIPYQPEAIRVLLTGYSDMESIVSAINDGHIYRYLHKPWDPTDLVATIDEAVKKFDLIKQVDQQAQLLAQANIALKELDAAKTQFMVLINHELKTPLTGIISYLELLQETALDEEQTTYASQIKKNAERLRRMIQDSLLIVAAEAKTLSIKITRFNPGHLDLRLSDEFEGLRQKKNLSLDIDLPQASLVGDSHLISQVLRRLLENAVRFAQPDSRVTLGHQILPSHRMQLTVTNVGPQFDQLTLKNLGKPFFIAEDIMKHSQGTGLGLSVVGSLLSLHQSKLEIENLQEGPQVSFILPYV